MSTTSDQPGDPASVRLAAGRILDSIRTQPRIRHVLPATPANAPARAPGVPDLRTVEELLALLRRLVFPGFFESAAVTDAELPALVDHLTARTAAHVHEQVRIVLRYVCGSSGQEGWRAPTAEDLASPSAWGPWRARMARAGLPVDHAGGECDRVASLVTQRFLGALPEVRRVLSLDVLAAFDGDPAAEHTDEIVLCYPGLSAVFHHRLAHELYTLGVPLLPRIIAETAHRHTGIDIHPGAQIGDSFFVDHGAGTVIGETAVIGRQCKIYQGVTLGAKSFPKDERGRLIRGEKRHPTLGDRVTVYAGAVILGGDTTIGDDCVISGGVFVTNSVEPRHIVGQKKPDLRVLGNPAAPEFGIGI
jgi:serine O-acetyltransferase